MDRDIESLDEFDAIAGATGGLAGRLVQSVDLTERTEILRIAALEGAIFLGCALTDAGRAAVVAGGGLVFPQLPALPFDPYRSSLYAPGELYDGLTHGYAETLDARVYRWLQDLPNTHPLAAELACALHDYSITDALAEVLADQPAERIVGIMGGHAVSRDAAEYAATATLAHRLADTGRVVVTGGGPGAMEAANLGAAYPGPVEDLAGIVASLAAVPSFHPDVTHWAEVALGMSSRWPTSRFTVGIPTWFYGHEPPNPFATSTAKYFNNALREESLLRLCRGGIVYVRGAAGTVQEIFQAVTGNFYATEPAQITPLILLGREYWTATVPVWPLLANLARGRLMEDHLHLVDSNAEAWEALAIEAG